MSTYCGPTRMRSMINVHRSESAAMQILWFSEASGKAKIWLGTNPQNLGKMWLGGGEGGASPEDPGKSYMAS